MGEIKILNIKELPVESSDFTGVSLPYAKDVEGGTEYRTLDMAAYEVHLKQITDEAAEQRLEKDAGKALRFYGFTDKEPIGQSISDPNAMPYFCTVTKKFVFAVGNKFYGGHELLYNYYNDLDKGTIRQDKVYLCETDIYCYESVKGIENMGTTVVQTTGESTEYVISQKGVSDLYNSNKAKIDALASRTSNVDNTHDMDKPVSNAVKTALDGKVNTEELDTVAERLEERELKVNTEARMTMPFDGIVNVTQPIILNKFPIAPYKIVYDANYGTYGAFLAEKDGSYFLDFYEEKYYNNDVHQPLNRKVFINNAQSYVYIESKGLVLNGGEIKQEYGESSNDTMSQKAITDTISRVTQILDSDKEDKAKTIANLTQRFDRLEEVTKPIEEISLEGTPDAIIYDFNTRRFVYQFGDRYVNNYIYGDYYNETPYGPIRKDKVYICEGVAYIPDKGRLVQITRKFGDEIYDYLKRNVGINFQQDIRIPVYTELNGSIQDGAVTERTNFYHTSAIQIKRGESLIIYCSQQCTPFWETDEKLTYFKNTGVKANTIGVHKKHWNIYTATKDIYISVSYYRYGDGPESSPNDSFNCYVIRNGFLTAIADRYENVESAINTASALYKSKIIKGSYINRSGGVTENELYSRTDYIPILIGKPFKIISFQIGNPYMSGIAFYDANKVYIKSYSGITEKENADYEFSIEEIPENAAYFRTSLYNPQIRFADMIYTYDPFILTDNIIRNKSGILNLQNQINNIVQREKKSFGRFEKSGNLKGNESLVFPEIHIGKNFVMTANLSGNVENVQIGLGYSTSGINRSYNSVWVEITPTNINGYTYFTGQPGKTEHLHGLKLGTDTIVTITNKLIGKELKTSVTLSNGTGDEYTVDIAFGNGRPFITNKGTSEISVESNFIPCDITKKIWAFGDSYFSFVYDARWPYYLTQRGETNWLSDNQPGLAPNEAYTEFVNLLEIGKPQKVLWCLGMNGPSGEEQVDGQYVIDPWQKRYIDNMVALCKEKDIELILSVIPTVPDRQKTGFGIYVKGLGLRYVDFAKAVGTNALGEWKPGLLSGDNVHPSVKGGQVLFTRVLTDFPEITVNE